MSTRLRTFLALVAGVLLVAGLAPGAAQAATTVTIPVHSDTMVRGDQPGDSFGNNSTVRVDDGAPKIAYFKFDPAAHGVPAGATITGATLTVVGSGSQSVLPVELRRTTVNTWTEATTYNTRPGLGEVLGTGSIGANTRNFSLPSFPDGNGVIGIAMVRTGSGTDNIIHSQEASTASNRPKLVLTYETGTTPPPTNQAPTVSAGADQSTTLPDNSVNLDGAVSDDGLPAGSTVTQTWSEASGPGTVTFGSSSAQDTTASFSAAGSYVLRLTASDGSLTSSDTVTITVNPADTPPPTGEVTETNQFVTAYSWHDNDPPGSGAIAHEDVRPGTGASGDGSFANPLTVAIPETKTHAPGTKVYFDHIDRYGIIEDECATSAAAPDGCTADYDVWVDGRNLTAAQAQACMESITGNYPVIINPVQGKPVATGPVCEGDTTPPPPPPNAPPTVSAGSDQSITLPDNTADLNGTVNDPDSTETTAWSRVSGPGTVTFANAAAVDTVATFSAAGTYDLRLTANDGVNPAVSDVVRVVVNPQATTPPPPAGDTIRSIAMSRATLMSLPTSGTQWQRIVTMANQSFAYSPTENNPEGGGNVVAGAIVAVRTNNSSMAAKVNAALDTFQGTAPSAYSHAGFNREGAGYVQAGEIMGRNTTAWRSILNRHLTERHSADGGSDLHALVMRGALNGSNNHHFAAFQTAAALVAALNDTTRANDMCASAKAALGGSHTQNGGWSMVNQPQPTGRQRGTQDESAAQSWYVQSNLRAINAGDPAQSIRNGAMPGDVHRDNGNYPNPGSSGISQYVFGAGFRFAGGAVSLHGMGCTGLFTYADNAFERMREWIDLYGEDPTNHHAHGDNLLEYVYGRDFSSAGGSTTASGESALVAASWLGQSGTWLR